MTQAKDTEEEEFIEEDPMTREEIEEALRPRLSRTHRRLVTKALYEAGLIVFRC